MSNTYTVNPSFFGISDSGEMVNGLVDQCFDLLVIDEHNLCEI